MAGIAHVAYESICCCGWKGWRGHEEIKPLAGSVSRGSWGSGISYLGDSCENCRQRSHSAPLSLVKLLVMDFFVLSKLICRKWNLLMAATGNARAECACLGCWGRQVGTCSSIHPCPDPFTSRHCNGPFPCVRRTRAPLLNSQPSLPYSLKIIITQHSRE